MASIPFLVNDADLTAALDAARAGDERGMTSLFRLLQPPLLRYLRHHAPTVAEDLASETWLAFSQVVSRFEGDGADARAWMFSVARRRVADHWRAQHRRPKLVGVGEAPTPLVPDVADAVVAELSTQSAVEALVRDLPEDQAEVVLLRLVAGLTADEVGAILHKSPTAVRVAQHRALRRLAKTWGRTTVPP